MEKEMENEIETRGCIGLIRGSRLPQMGSS